MGDLFAASEVPERLASAWTSASRGTGQVVRCQQSVPRGRELSFVPCVGLEPCRRRREEQSGPLGVVLRPELERPVVVVHGSAEGAEGGGAIACVSQSEAGPTAAAPPSSGCRGRASSALT